MKKRQIGITLGCLAILGVLVWGSMFGGFSSRTPVQPNHNSTTNCTGRSSLETGKIYIGSAGHTYKIGVSVSSQIVVRNGENVSANYLIICRQPDNPLEGYIKAPSEYAEWFQLGTANLTLAACSEGTVPVSLLIPENTPESDFIIYYATTEGRQYLNNAIEQTVSSEGAMAAAFKEELVNYTDVYGQFDNIYANRGDKYVFKALYDAFPYRYDEFVDAWERAIVNVKADLSAIPYADALWTLDQLGAVTQTKLATYPGISSLPAQYMNSVSAKNNPWEIWVTVTRHTTGLVEVEYACRCLVDMTQNVSINSTT